MSEKSNKELLEDLGIEEEFTKRSASPPHEERVIAGFEEIQRFVGQHGHPPVHGEDNDIFERLYATRLDQIRSNDECRNLVQELDYQGFSKVRAYSRTIRRNIVATKNFLPSSVLMHRRRAMLTL